MKKAFQLKTLLLSMAVAGAASVSMVPAAAQAEVSYNAAVSNMYLWRGQDISDGQGFVSGGIDYSHDSGLYAGVWTGSEAAGTETDLYVGYALTSGDFGVDLSYAAYLYPSDGTKSTFDRADGSLASEYGVKLSYADLSASAMINTEETSDIYYSLGYAIGSVSLHAGMYDFKAANSDYTDYSIAYAATDALSFTLSVAQGDGIAAEDEKPMLNVTYSFPL